MSSVSITLIHLTKNEYRGGGKGTLWRLKVGDILGVDKVFVGYIVDFVRKFGVHCEKT